MSSLIRISPSLISSFRWYKIKQGDDDPDVRATARREWLDKLSCVPSPTTAAQQRGKDFEDLINRGPESWPELSEKPRAAEKNYRQCLQDVTDYLNNSCGGVSEQQVHCWRILDGKYMIHGYIDYLTPMKIIDLKTTSRMSYGNYVDSPQSYFYTWCLHPRGYRHFEFLVTDLRNVFVIPESWSLSGVELEQAVRGAVSELMNDFMLDEEAATAFFEKYQKKEVDHAVL